MTAKSLSKGGLEWDIPWCQGSWEASWMDRGPGGDEGRRVPEWGVEDPDIAL